MTKIEKIRKEIPALHQQVYGKQLVYFDNAATAHKPQSVISRINEMNGGINANIHRAVHKLSADATELYEAARNRVQTFINAPKRQEIIFTSGTTASINLVAYSFSEKYLKKGDSIIISESEHHSNIVPWQMACERKGASLKILPVDENGVWEMDKFDALLDESVKMVAVAHISNVLGIFNPIKELIQKAHRAGAQVLIDGAQGIVHADVDVQDIDCDYYVFSGHKIYAATGIGVLYSKEKHLEELPPWMGGGDMVETVSFQKTTYAELPLKFEAGTPNFIGASSFTPAIDFAEMIKDSEFANNEGKMTSYLNEHLNKIEGLTLYGKAEHKAPVFSFAIEGIHHSDLAAILDKMGIAVRSGMMCAEPLMKRFGQTGMTRASLAPYNTLEECEIFTKALDKAVLMLR